MSLSYEETLAALQAFIGKQVIVQVGDRPSPGEGCPQTRAVFGGVLRSRHEGEQFDFAEFAPDEDAVVFTVRGDDEVAWGAFIARESAFRGGQWQGMGGGRGRDVLVITIGQSVFVVQPSMAGHSSGHGAP